MDHEGNPERPDMGIFYAFDHVTFNVGNAKQAASYYTSRFGFEYLAYRGLENGARDYATHVVKNGKIVLVFVSPLTANDDVFAEQYKKHGDGVKDIAFTVDDV